MRGPRLLIGLLVAASVLVDLVAWSILRHRWPQLGPSHPAVLVFQSLCFSQVSLLAIWAALGRKATAWRLMGLMVGIALWARLLANTVEPEGPLDPYTTVCAVLLLVHAIIVVGPLSIARAMGVGLVHAAADAAHGRPDAKRPKLQFSLGQIFAWMTSLAVCLGLTKYLVHYEYLSLFAEEWADVALICVSRATLALSALWLALGTRWPAARAAVLCLVVAVAVVTSPRSFSGADVAGFVLETLLLVGSLGVIRLAGWRLVVSTQAAGSDTAKRSTP